MIIPLNASLEIQESIRDIWKSLDPFLTREGVPLNGRRFIGCGKSQSQDDFVIRAELTDLETRLKKEITVARSEAGQSDLIAEVGTGYVLRTDGTSTLSGARTITGVWAFNPSSGSVPFTTTKSSVVTNLNADQVDGAEPESGSGALARLDGTGNFTATRRFEQQIDVGNPTNDAQLSVKSAAAGTVALEVDCQATPSADPVVFRINNSIKAGLGVSEYWYCVNGCHVAGDPGAGSATMFTGATDTPTSDPGWTSSSTVDMNAPDGYIKIYVASQAAVVPYWNT